MANYDLIAQKVIEKSDIILLVLDARKIDETRNQKLEDLIKKNNKKILFVINKIDLITKKEQSKIKLKDSIQISSKNHIGTMNLLRKILETSKGKQATVGIVGFPNTGKSTILNALKGKHSAETSSASGHTKAIQKIRVNKKITLLDTPGVFSYKKDDVSNIIIGAISADRLKDPENTAMELIEFLEGKIEEFYDVEKSSDSFETLEKIAIKKNILKKGGIPDTIRAGREIIKLWQSGKIKSL